MGRRRSAPLRRCSAPPSVHGIVHVLRPSRHVLRPSRHVRPPRRQAPRHGPRSDSLVPRHGPAGPARGGRKPQSDPEARPWLAGVPAQSGPETPAPAPSQQPPTARSFARPSGSTAGLRYSRISSLMTVPWRAERLVRRMLHLADAYAPSAQPPSATVGGAAPRGARREPSAPPPVPTCSARGPKRRCLATTARHRDPPTKQPLRQPCRRWSRDPARSAGPPP